MEDPSRRRRSWRELARAERRRYWTPRALRRWVWTAAVLEGLLLFALGLASAFAGRIFEPDLVVMIWLHGLCHVGLWGSAWIGADLLSRNRPDNPDPHRDPHPGEVFAGFIGRLTPFYAAYLLWLVTLAVACGAGGVDAEGLEGQVGLSQSYRAVGERLLDWTGWVIAIGNGTLAYGMIAALLSGFFRRPRPLLVTLTSVIPGTVLLCGIVLLLLSLGEFGSSVSASILQDISGIASFAAVNPLCAGLLWAQELEHALPNGSGDYQAQAVQLHTILFYLTVSAVCGAGVLQTASWRHRQTTFRHQA